MKYTIQGIDVYYEIHGEGRPLLMIHGYSPDHHLMSGCMEPIFQQRDGWKRIYFDLPGMGKTPAQAWLTNSDQMLDIVMEFINYVIPNQNFSIASESYGSYLARGIIHHKCDLVDGLLMICPLILPDADQRTYPEHVVLVKAPEMETLLAALEPEEREEFESMTVVQTPEILQRTQDEVWVGIDASDEAFLSRFRESGYGFSVDVDVALKSYEKPTLILTGRQDSGVGYRDAWNILETYPRATFAVLDRAGHNLQIEQASIFNALVHEWLVRIEEECN